MVQEQLNDNYTGIRIEQTLEQLTLENIPAGFLSGWYFRAAARYADFSASSLKSAPPSASGGGKPKTAAASASDMDSGRRASSARHVSSRACMPRRVCFGGFFRKRALGIDHALTDQSLPFKVSKSASVPASADTAGDFMEDTLPCINRHLVVRAMSFPLEV